MNLQKIKSFLVGVFGSIIIRFLFMFAIIILLKKIKNSNIYQLIMNLIFIARKTQSLNHAK